MFFSAYISVTRCGKKKPKYLGYHKLRPRGHLCRENMCDMTSGMLARETDTFYDPRICLPMIVKGVEDEQIESY